MDKLLLFLKSKIFINKADEELLNSLFKRHKIKEKEVLIKEGIIHTSLYFINSGFVKGFKYNDGKLTIEHIVSSHHFFGSLESIQLNQPSAHTFTTTVESEILSISQKNLQQLLAHGAKWSEALNIILNDSLTCKVERLRDFQTQTATDRYLKLLKTNPNVTQHLSVEELSSYLGIAPSSLSRIKKQIIS